MNSSEPPSAPITKGMAMRPIMKLTGRLALLAVAVVATSLVLPAPGEAANQSSASLTRQLGASALVDGSVGGTLVSGKWKLEITPGSFNGKATITMLEVTAADRTPTVDISISDPALNSFKNPVWLSHTDSGNKDKAIYWWDPANQVWRAVPGQLIELLDVLNVQLKVPLFHFSTYSVKGGKAGW